MISVSEAFQRAIAENSGVLVRADLKLADGTEMELSGDDVMMGTLSISQSTSSSGSFDVGAAIIGSLDVALNNMDGRFDAIDFTGATLRPYVGKALPGGTTEWVRRSTYWVDQPDSYGGTISLTGLDAMSRLERPYSEADTAYPATIQEIVADACLACGVTLATSQIPNGSYVVSRRPDDESLTCLAVVSYAAQVAGCWCRVDNLDRLVLGWYDLDAWEGEAWLDGGSLDGDETPYPDGDDADGGSFDAYGATTGDKADGGGFEARPYLVMSAFSSLSLCTDDVVVTGVSVKASDDLSEDEGGTGEEGEAYLFGEDGYVLAISDNPLVLYGEAATVGDYLGGRIAGMRFRPFSGSVVGDPSVEAGDPVVVVDAKQNMHLTHVTSYSYKAGGYASVSCDAETPSRNSAATYSAVTRNIVAIRNAVRLEADARRKAIEDLQEELATSSGLYCTEDPQDDGSVVYYFHDKPTLAESTIVWKFTAEAMGISTDGGETYPYGLDVSGTAILERIYAVGIDADYITSGSVNADLIKTGNIDASLITVGVMDASLIRNGILMDTAGHNLWNLVTGEFRLSYGSKVGAGSETIGEMAVSADVQYGLSDSPTEQPTSWTTTALWQQGRHMWTRTKVTLANGDVQYSTPRRITNDKGIGAAEVTEQYYLSTSQDSQTGGSWLNSQPAWVSGRYYWTRSRVTWSDGSVTYTEPQLARGLTSGNQATDDLDESLTQQEVFNRLTDNGALKGIYMSSGELYVNASYVSTGILSDAAGKNFWNFVTGEFSLSSDTTVGDQTVSAIADNAANGALSSAKDYADDAASDALASAKDYTDWLDDDLNQTEIYNRLTNNGQTQGIYMSGGKLYLNASYMNAGTLSANLIKAGVISDQAGKSSWNLVTGALSLNGSLTVGSTSSYNLRLTGGYFYMYFGSTRVSQMYANGANQVTWNMSEKTLQLNAKDFRAVDSDLSAGGSGYTFDLKCPICTKAMNNGDGTITANNSNVLISGTLGLITVLSWPGATSR